VTFELKWYIPVCDLQLDQTSNVQGLLVILRTEYYCYCHCMGQPALAGTPG